MAGEYGAMRAFLTKPYARSETHLTLLAKFLTSSQGFFQGFEEEPCVALAKLVDHVHFKEGTIFQRADGLGDTMYIVLTGTCDMHHQQPQQPGTGESPLEHIGVLAAGQSYGEVFLVNAQCKSPVQLTAGVGGCHLATFHRGAYASLAFGAVANNVRSAAKQALLLGAARALIAQRDRAQNTAAVVERLSLLLTHLEPFKRFPVETIRQLAVGCRLAHIPASAVLFEEDDKGDAMFIVLCGTCEVRARPLPMARTEALKPGNLDALNGHSHGTAAQRQHAAAAARHEEPNTINHGPSAASAPTQPAASERGMRGSEAGGPQASSSGAAGTGPQSPKPPARKAAQGGRMQRLASDPGEETGSFSRRRPPRLPDGASPDSPLRPDASRRELESYRGEATLLDAELLAVEEEDGVNEDNEADDDDPLVQQWVRNGGLKTVVLEPEPAPPAAAPPLVRQPPATTSSRRTLAPVSDDGSDDGDRAGKQPSKDAAPKQDAHYWVARFLQQTHKSQRFLERVDTRFKGSRSVAASPAPAEDEEDDSTAEERAAERAAQALLRADAGMTSLIGLGATRGWRAGQRKQGYVSEAPPVAAPSPSHPYVDPWAPVPEDDGQAAEEAVVAEVQVVEPVAGPFSAAKHMLQQLGTHNAANVSSKLLDEMNKRASLQDVLSSCAQSKHITGLPHKLSQKESAVLTKMIHAGMAKTNLNAAGRASVDGSGDFMEGMPMPKAAPVIYTSVAWETKEAVDARFGPVIRMLTLGETFGELALLQKNACRTASIVTGTAKAGVDVMEVSRTCYNLTVRAIQEAQMQELLVFLRLVEPFRLLTHDQLTSLALFCHHSSVDSGAIIAREGQGVKQLTMVCEGDVTVMKQQPHDGHSPKTVKGPRIQGGAPGSIPVEATVPSTVHDDAGGIARPSFVPDPSASTTAGTTGGALPALRSSSRNSTQMTSLTTLSRGSIMGESVLDELDPHSRRAHAAHARHSSAGGHDSDSDDGEGGSHLPLFECTIVANKPCKLLSISAVDLRRFGWAVRVPLRAYAAARRTFLSERGESVKTTKAVLKEQQLMQRMGSSPSHGRTCLRDMVVDLCGDSSNWPDNRVVAARRSMPGYLPSADTNLAMRLVNSSRTAARMSVEGLLPGGAAVDPEVTRIRSSSNLGSARRPAGFQVLRRAVTDASSTREVLLPQAAPLGGSPPVRQRSLACKLPSGNLLGQQGSASAPSSPTHHSGGHVTLPVVSTHGGLLSPQLAASFDHMPWGRTGHRKSMQI